VNVFLVPSLLVLVLLLNFFILGTSRLRTVVNASAAQGVALGLLALWVHPHVELVTVVVALGAAAIKGALIPFMLFRAMRDIAVRREVEPFIGYVPSLLLCAVATGAALVFTSTLPLAPEHRDTLLVPASLSTVLSGFLLLTTRRKAITQVVGYLLLENGIYIMGLLLLQAMPFLVEVGVLLDLFVAIFVMGIIINHINREFASLDTSRLTALKE
jgi:hydrogenase-4 component E